MASDDVVVSQSTSKVLKKGEEELELPFPFSFMGKTKSSFDKDFTVP